jgi:hypothetical protein
MHQIKFVDCLVYKYFFVFFDFLEIRAAVSVSCINQWGNVTGCIVLGLRWELEVLRRLLCFIDRQTDRQTEKEFF